MRKLISQYLPDHTTVRENRWLAPFGNTLLHPRLWHLNRHSAAGAVAAGMFCGLIPGPFQMLGAAICAVYFRVNLPLALFTTLYTNPFTIIPLYVAAFTLGKLCLGLLGHSDSGEFIAPPEIGAAGLLAWFRALSVWTTQLGRPLLTGLMLLAIMLAFAGYVVVWLAWRWHIAHAWRARGQRRKFA